MFEIRCEQGGDHAARERLLDLCFGEARFAKTSERLREDRLPADGLALVAEGAGGRVVGTVRLWNVSAGPGRAALLLGPLAVAPDLQGCGLGGALMRAALGRAAEAGHRAVLLVGDAPYYARFGFTGVHTRALWLPGPYAPERFLGRELAPGALAGAAGLVQATGRLAPLPDLATLVAATAVDGRRPLAA